MNAPTESERQARLARESKRLRWAWAITTAALFAGVGAWLYFAHPANGSWIWAQILGLATLPGKYLIFGGLHHDWPLSPCGIAALAVHVDIVTSLSLAVFLGLLRRIGWIDRTLRKAHDRAEDVLTEYPRLRRMAFWGVVLFVVLPLPASGSIGGTFVGQIVGLTRTQGAIAVCFAGAIVAAVFAGLAVLLGAEAERMLANPWISIVSIALFIAFLYIGWRRVRKTLRH